MITCESMTDRMPLVVHGRADWSAEEAAHLAGCPACTAEWRLILAARELGAAATRQLTADGVGRAVMGRLAHARRRRRWGLVGLVGSLVAAALVAILVWAGPGRRGAARAVGAGPALELPLAELERLDEGELTAVLQAMEAPLGGEASPDAPGLGDLQDSELERVLRSLEG